MLKILDTVCGYGKVPVLEALSFSVEAGEILCILGANGIGKTTLFKSILGHIGLISGQILLDGKNIELLNNTDRAKQMAYVPQAHIPPFPYKVIDVVVMGRAAHIKTFAQPTKADTEIAEEALRVANIIDLRDKAYTEISGGERQLVLIARAIAQESGLLIMDEPMANLDFGNQSRIMKQIRDLALTGISVIYTTHNPEHAFLCSDKVLAIKSRTKYALGEAGQIITNDLLREIYHIDAEIMEIKLRDRLVRVCIPCS
jgi:iron complex transport system ATP-binding protein